jgi:hypothetical protein
MESVSKDELISALGHSAIAQMAPQELPYFQTIYAAFLEDPARMLKRDEKDRAIGFGLVEIGSAILLSPIVLAVLNEALSVLVEQVKQTGFVRRIFTKLGLLKEKATIKAPLTPDDARLLYKTVKEVAPLHGLSAAQAQQLADAVVAKLVMS